MQDGPASRGPDVADDAAHARRPPFAGARRAIGVGTPMRRHRASLVALPRAPRARRPARHERRVLALDHDPQRRLRARRPDEDAAAAGRAGLAPRRWPAGRTGPPPTGPCDGPGPRAAAAAAAGCRAASSARAAPARAMTRSTSSAVTMPSPDVVCSRIDDVAALLAAQAGARDLHPLEDVLVADGRPDTWPPAASTACCEPAVREHATTTSAAAAGRRGASRSSARMPEEPVAVDDLAALVDRHAAGRRRRRARSRRRRRARRRPRRQRGRVRSRRSRG